MDEDDVDPFVREIWQRSYVGSGLGHHACIWHVPLSIGGHQQQGCVLDHRQHRGGNGWLGCHTFGMKLTQQHY